MEKVAAYEKITEKFLKYISNTHKTKQNKEQDTHKNKQPRLVVQEVEASNIATLVRKNIFLTRVKIK